jgi:hypothetical protein
VFDNCAVPGDVSPPMFDGQFLVGPRDFTAHGTFRQYDLWDCYRLAVHPSLEVSIENFDGARVVLIGLAFDASDASALHGAIARKLGQSASVSLEALLHATDTLAGRWVVLARTKTGTAVFSDPCGFRRIFYTPTDQGLWIGSSPTIIRSQIDLELDMADDVRQFLADSRLAKREYAWVGERTIYARCKALLPNHYVDFRSGRSVRFFPRDPIAPQLDTQVAPRAAFLLKGAIEAASRHSKVVLPVTAGLDSRLLLAASRSIKDSGRITYYIDRMGIIGPRHPDIRVPQALAARLGINFEVRNSATVPPDWFMQLLKTNVGNARDLPKTRMIYSKYLSGDRRLNINGNGSEICRGRSSEACRSSFHAFGRSSRNSVTGAELAASLGYRAAPYVVAELEKWLVDAQEACSTSGMEILDLFYWEQRMGLWGAQFPAEQDLACDEISPFNCRAWLVEMLSVDIRRRMRPDYSLYRDMMNLLWPEVLAEPINPLEFSVRGVKRAIKALIKPYVE